MARTSLRIVNDFHHVGGEWFAVGSESAVNQQIERAKREVRAYQNAEPVSGWKLQTRGEFGDWHDFEPANVYSRHPHRSA